jgi:DNA-binding transcriptional MerR regulator/effector-binding domain-containing protein
MKYRIGEFSKMAKMSVKTLRYYDEIGLLKPNKVDGWNRYRYYSTEQLGTIQTIFLYRDAGLSIDETKQMLLGHDIKGLLESRRDELTTERERISTELSNLERIIMNEKKNEHNAIVKDIPGCVVYCGKGKIANFQEMTKFILGTAEECLEANPGLECDPSDYCFVTYLDKEFKDREISIEYSQAVKRTGIETENITFKKLEPVTAICVMHKGSYDKLGNAYSCALEFIEENEYQMCENPRECYIAGCWNRDNESDYLTEIQIPIKKMN